MPVLSFALLLCTSAPLATGRAAQDTARPPVSPAAFQRAFETALDAEDFEAQDRLLQEHPEHFKRLAFSYSSAWCSARGQGREDLASMVRLRGLAEAVDLALEAPGLLEMADVLEGLSDQEFVAFIRANQELAGVDALRVAGQVDQAVAVLQRMAEYFDGLSWHLGSLTACDALGNLLQSVGRYEEALPWNRRALELAQLLGDPLDLFRAHGELGAALIGIGDRDAAELHYRRALDLAPGVAPPVATHPYLFGLACCLQSRFRHEEAAELHRRALELKEPLGNPYDIASSLAAYGRSLGYLGRNEEAVEVLQRALGLFEFLDRKLEAAGARQSLGGSYEALGRFDAAVDTFERAVAAFQELGMVPELSMALSNLGVCYSGMGQPERAQDQYVQALELAEREGITSSVPDILRSMATLSYEEGRWEEAEAALRRCRELALERGDAKCAAAALCNLGALAREAGHLDEALECLERVQVELAQVGDPNLQGFVGYSKGWLLMDLERWDEAVEVLQRAVALRRASGDPESTAAVLFRLGQAWEHWGRPAEAVRCFAEVSTELERVSVRSFSDHQQASFRDRWQYVPLCASRAAGEAEGDREALEQAFGVVEASRARSLVGRVTERSRDVMRSADPERQAARDEQVRTIEAARLRLEDAREAGIAAEELGELQRELRVQEEELERLTRRLRSTNPALMELAAPQVTGLSALQQELLQDGQVLVEFVQDELGSAAWVVTRDTVRVLELPAEPLLRAPYEEFLASVSPGAAKDATFVGPSRELFQVLLGGVDELARCEELILVPDGFLGHLPFEALLTRDPTEEERTDLARLPYLLRDVTVRYAPSASFLQFLAGRKAVSREWSKDALLLGDPVFAREREAVAREATRSRASLDPATFERLRGTRDEVLTIAEELIGDEELNLFRDLRRLERSGHLSGQRFDLYLGSEVNDARLTGDLTGYRVLHIATHGYFDPEYPWFSGLVLSDPTEGDAATGSGFLSLMELGNLHLDAELAFLSACETGAGQLSHSEGIQSTARSFLIAGAGSVVCTQWAVGDREAAVVARVFYERYLREGMSPAAALRAGKVGLIDGGEEGSRGFVGVDGEEAPAVRNPQAHPSVWAPFVVWGG